jgi:phytoene dehydrogenase-like protein
MIFTLAVLAGGDGGFPEGGSLPFVRRVVKTFKNLGGEIRYKMRADRVVVENGKATGAISGDELFLADAVIGACDTMVIDQLFDRLPQASWLDEMRAITAPTMSIQISLGINADLKHYPDCFIIKLKKPIYLADQEYHYLNLSNYAADPTYSPQGKTAMTIYLYGDTYNFWKTAKKENQYADEKQRIANQIIAEVTAQIPEADGKIEVCDVASPLTYERYCGTWKGSWMSDITHDMRSEDYPITIKGLDGVYFAGHRMNPPGGLASAMASGVIAVQQLCHDTNTTFGFE